MGEGKKKARQREYRNVRMLDKRVKKMIVDRIRE